MKMTGTENVLNVYLGEEVIAKLALVNDQLHWHYTQFWRQTGYAVSPHLPLHGDIPTLNVQCFLRNMLPEETGLEVLLNSFHLSKSNTFGLVRALGMDIPGSLIMLTSEQTFPREVFFRCINDSELEQRLDSHSEFSLIVWDGKPRLSVAGIQDKINVVVNEEGHLGFGEGSLCSTHILKFEKQKSSHLVLNEFITMQLARQCGLNVADVKLMRYGKHPALLVKRFDRKFISIQEVKRRHIIDGCQALNLLPEHKYERIFGSGRDVAHIRDGASLIKLFEFANQCVSPILTKQQLIDWVLFNTLVFNYDAHGKNISFFVDANGIALAPFYDLVNIKIYPEFEHEMAMALGDEFDGNVINAYQLADFADSCQISRSILIKRLKSMIEKLVLSLNDKFESVASNAQEKSYLTQYQHLVRERCEHLFQQADDILLIEL
jgi:serine/threonine-protein kinase HipA